MLAQERKVFGKVATALTVYGIETEEKTMSKLVIYGVATALTVYGIETAPVPF